MPSEVKNKLADLALNSDLTMIDKKDFVALGRQYFVESERSKSIGSFRDARQALNGAEVTELQAMLKKANDKKGKIQAGAIGTQGYPNLSGREAAQIERDYLKGKFNLNNNGGKMDKADQLGAIYDEMAKIYQQTVQNPKEILISSNLINKKKANAVYNTAESAVGVNLAAIQSQGFQGFLQFTKDASNINFYDMKNNPVSFYGPNISGVEKTKEIYEDEDDIYRHVKIGEMILRDYYNNMGKKDYKTFNLSSVQVAVEDRNKAAMIVYPTMDVLKKLKEAEGKGLLDEELINTIATNGISFVSDRKNFNNWLIKGNELDPTEAMVNALGKISYTDPMGGGSYKIEKDEFGTAPYKVSLTYDELQPDGTKIQITKVVPPVNFQNNISIASNLAKDALRDQAQDNMRIWQTFLAQGYKPGVSQVNSQQNVQRSFTFNQ